MVVSDMENYHRYTGRKRLVLVLLVVLVAIASVVAINAGSMDLSPKQVVQGIMGRSGDVADMVIWNIRLPSHNSGIVAGGLSVAGCVMQNNLRNPLLRRLRWDIQRSCLRRQPGYHRLWWPAPYEQSAPTR